MPYNGSGTYALPDIIEPATPGDANEVQAILNDIGNAFNVAFCRDGQSAMSGQFKAADGTVSAPSITFNADTNTGIYRIGGDNIGIAAGGTKIVDISASGTSFSGTAIFSGTVTLPNDTVSTAVIANNAVTYAKLQDVSATARILGRKSAGAGDPEECTLSEVLDFIGSAAQGDILYRGASGWQRLPAGSANNVLLSGGASANPSWGDVFVHGSAVSLSGTSVDLTGISPRAKIIDVYVYDAVYNASTRLAFQLGTSSGIETSGYASLSTYHVGGGGTVGHSSTSAFVSALGVDNLSHYGRIRFTNVTGNMWGVDALFCAAGVRTIWIAGGKGLSGTLDRIRVTTESGTASFTSGSVVVSQILA